MGGLLVYALTPITHIFLPYSWLPCFRCFFSYFSCFLSFPLVFSLCYSVLLFTMHIYGFLYYLLWQGLPFLPFNYFWPIVGVLPRLSTGLPAAQLPPLPCVGCAMLHFQTKVVLFFFFTSFGTHQNKGWVSLSLTSIVCT